MISTTTLVLVLAQVLSAVAGKPNTFQVVGKTGVSAQQMFLGSENKVYIIDKTENNPITVKGHPAWATEYDLPSNKFRVLDLKTNTFCAGGGQLGNGSWISVGGNQAVSTGGNSNWDAGFQEGGGIYQVYSGGRTTRIMTPCDTGDCNWTEDIYGFPINRWYPTVETIEDGSVIIIGGETNGSFVNSPNLNENTPTFEFWPYRGPPVRSQFLVETMPANLYPLTWLLPNGLLFIQANWQTTLVNYSTAAETRLPNIPRAQRTYPASGSTAMLPLTPANKYTPTILFCGGMNPLHDDWDPTKWAISEQDTSSSCVSINPMDKTPTYKDEDDLPQNRGMGNFIILPDSRLLLVNGVAKGSAGYGAAPWSIGQSYAQNPVFTPAYYNASAPVGSRWDQTNLPASKIGRLYHSSATLLPDGSVFIAGSNPNPEVTTAATNPDWPYKTTYDAEIFYPSYYDAPRPTPGGIPTSLSYGGDPFILTLPASNISPATNLDGIRVALVRTGFSTHGLNMGMRYIELENAWALELDGSLTLYVSQLPPNAALFAPGRALLFVVVDNIPSIGVFTMVGSGQIGQQPLSLNTVLPASAIVSKAPPIDAGPSGGAIPSTADAGIPAATAKNDGGRLRVGLGRVTMLVGIVVAACVMA